MDCVTWSRDNVVVCLGSYDIEYNYEDNMDKITEFDNVDRVLWDRMCVGSMMLNRSGAGIVNIIEVAIVEQWSSVNKGDILRGLCGNP
jgi:hypothetical protein